MGPRSASKAAEMVGAKVAVPIHYTTFPLLVGSAEDLRSDGVTVREMQPGETWEVR